MKHSWRSDHQTGRKAKLGSEVPPVPFLSVHYVQYAHDALGRVSVRKDWATNRFENFEYDGLSRLTRHRVVGEGEVTLGYDALGNIGYKSDVGQYTYDAQRVHALRWAGSRVVFGYDANGNAGGTQQGSEVRSYSCSL